MRVVLWVLAVLTLSSPVAEAGKRIPRGKTLVVVGQSGADKADAFAAGTGVDPAGAMWYFGPYEGAGVLNAQLDAIEEAVETHPGLVVNLGMSFGSVSTPSPSYTAAIAAGAYDAELRLIARRLKALPTSVYARLGYEFDLLGGQYGPPAVYKQAFRHIVRLFRAEGVRNTAFVWHSAGAFWRATDPSLFAVQSGTLATALRGAPVEIDPQPIRAFYPGRRYVDAFAISYWQDACCFGESSEQAKAVYEARTRELLDQAKALRLPLMIGESTPANIGADSGAKSAAWVERSFDLIEDYDIRMWALISIDWTDGGFFAAPFWNGYWPDARIHAFAATRDAFLRRVAAAEDRYVFRPPAR